MTGTSEMREELVRIQLAPRMCTNMSGDKQRAIADEILGAGYQKPRTISSWEELDALPDGTIIGVGLGTLRREGFPWLLAMQRGGGLWFSPATEFGVTSQDFELIALPAAVLWEPIDADRSF